MIARLVAPLMAPLVAPFRWLGRAVAGEQLRLPDELLATFPELADARWRRGGLFVRVGGWCIGTSTVAGITLWRTVWLAPGVPLHPALLLHELRHVHQFGADLLFPLSYIWESFRRGYRGNRYEADAIAYARHRLLGGRHPPPQKEP